MASKSGRGPKATKKEGTSSDSPREAGRPRVRSGWAANVETIAGAVALAFFIRIVLVEAFEIEGPSMEPTLLNGDRVVVAKYRYGLFLPLTSEAFLQWSTPKVGEVVIVKSPDDVVIVKRVVGLEGDVMEIRNDVVLRNERPMGRVRMGPCDAAAQLDRTAGCGWYKERTDGLEWRTSKDDQRTPPQTYPPVVVPKGHVYVLGDHRDRSNDSRFFGPVRVNRVRGQALMIYWSSDGGWWWQPDYVFRGSRMFNLVR